MISAVDSSVLLAILLAESSAEAWMAKLIDAGENGSLVICDIVSVEVGSCFNSFAEFSETLDQLTITFDPLNMETTHYAGTIFRRYRKLGGKRDHLIPDFLIGAHAEKQADQLIAADRGYLRRYFSNLKVDSIS